MEICVEVFVTVHCLIIGLSHVVQPRAWIDLMIWLREREAKGVFCLGFLYLWTGSLIVSFHWIWSGLAAVLTVLGIVCLIKAAVCFLVPSLQLRSLARVSHDRPRDFQIGGSILIVLSVLLAVIVARSRVQMNV